MQNSMPLPPPIAKQLIVWDIQSMMLHVAKH